MEENREYIKLQKDHSEITIDLVPIFHALLKKWWILLLAIIIGGALSYGGTKLLVTPMYKSSFAAYVNNNKTQSDNQIVQSSDMSAGESMAGAYAEIISRRTILEESAQSIGKNYTFEEMKKNVTTKAVSSQSIVEVMVVMADPVEAYNLANAIMKTTSQRGIEIVEGSNMQIVESPVIAKTIYSPNYVRNAIIGALIFFILAVAVIVILTVTNDTIGDRQAIEENFGLTMLGCIPTIRKTEK